MTSHAVSDEALDIIFRDAHTQNKWQDKPVSNAHLMAVYDLMRWGPTESNITPARFHFVVSKEAKARLEPLVHEGNRKQTMAAPATAIVGYDLDFARTLSKLAPHATALPDLLAKDPQKARLMAMRGAGMQGGYFVVAARALGLDCGPMSGFDNDGVDKEFFAGTAIKSYFLCNLGYGDPAGLRPRAARLSFDEACRILCRYWPSIPRWGDARRPCWRAARFWRTVSKPWTAAMPNAWRRWWKKSWRARERHLPLSTGLPSPPAPAPSPASGWAWPSCAECAWR